jgi:hypothetical protein
MANEQALAKAILVSWPNSMDGLGSLSHHHYGHLVLLAALHRQSVQWPNCGVGNSHSFNAMALRSPEEKPMKGSGEFSATRRPLAADSKNSKMLNRRRCTLEFIKYPRTVGREGRMDRLESCRRGVDTFGAIADAATLRLQEKGISLGSLALSTSNG